MFERASGAWSLDCLVPTQGENKREMRMIEK